MTQYSWGKKETRLNGYSFGGDKAQYPKPIPWIRNKYLSGQYVQKTFLAITLSGEKIDLEEIQILILFSQQP